MSERDIADHNPPQELVDHARKVVTDNHVAWEETATPDALRALLRDARRAGFLAQEMAKEQMARAERAEDLSDALQIELRYERERNANNVAMTAQLLRDLLPLMLQGLDTMGQESEVFTEPLAEAQRLLRAETSCRVEEK